MDAQPKDPHTVIVSLRDTEGTYTCDINAGKHQMVADEPVPLGGDDLGAAPYQYLKAALGFLHFDDDSHVCRTQKMAG